MFSRSQQEKNYNILRGIYYITLTQHVVYPLGYIIYINDILAFRVRVIYITIPCMHAYIHTCMYILELAMLKQKLPLIKLAKIRASKNKTVSV